MKKYITPAITAEKVDNQQILSGSIPVVKDKTTSSQLSKEGFGEWDDEEEDY